MFISSVAGLLSVENLSVYAATKAAVNQLIKNLACKWDKDSIEVNCVEPSIN